MEIHNIIWYNKPVLKKDMTDQMQDIMQNLTDFAAAMRVSGCMPKAGHRAGTVRICGKVLFLKADSFAVDTVGLKGK